MFATPTTRHPQACLPMFILPLAGAKTTDKSDQGELWGMHNLLKVGQFTRG